MTDATAADVRDRVTEVLDRHYRDRAFLVSSVTGGTAAVVTAGTRRDRLAQCAATLREAGFTVADLWKEGRLYVRLPGPEHDLAMAREIAGILRYGYNEHVRVHGPDSRKLTGDSGDGGRFTVEREGGWYDVIVVPRGEAAR